LKRTADGATEKTPIQPKTGATSSTVQDYLIPWDTDVVYTATVTTARRHHHRYRGCGEPVRDGRVGDPPGVPATVADDRPAEPHRRDLRRRLDRSARPADASEHRIVNNPFPVFTTIGSRQSLRGTLTLFAERETDRDAVTLLIDDQTPILFRYPTSIGAGWEDGFYNVGDYAEDQIGPRGGGWWKISLNLTRVQPPPVTTVAGWDYPTIAATFADYADLTASFADYPSLTADREL
jgi:hypothetical protein